MAQAVLHTRLETMARLENLVETRNLADIIADATRRGWMSYAAPCFRVHTRIFINIPALMYTHGRVYTVYGYTLYRESTVEHTLLILL